jgi:phosphonate transport system substrate-binding protein
MVNRRGAAPSLKPALSPEGHRRGWAMTLGFALLCLLVAPPRTSAQEAGPQHLSLHVAYTRSSFHNVNPSDAAAAFRIFAQTAARKRGYESDIDVQLFDSPAACEAEIKKGTINLAILDAWDYLGMDIQPVMEPVFVHLEQGVILKDYLLLTRRGSGLTVLADLRGKDLMMLEGKGGNLSRAWLDSLLLAQHLETKEAFFRKLEPVAKPSAAVLPVFFGTKSACLVDRAAFQIMSELNPQVGSNLLVLAVSDPYLESITCIGRSGWPSERARQDLIQAMAEFHLEPNGRQILELFKVDQLVPFKDEYLNTARKLWVASEPLGKKNLASLLGGQTKSEP